MRTNTHRFQHTMKKNKPILQAMQMAGHKNTEKYDCMHALGFSRLPWIRTTFVARLLFLPQPFLTVLLSGLISYYLIYVLPAGFIMQTALILLYITRHMGYPYKLCRSQVVSCCHGDTIPLLEPFLINTGLNYYHDVMRQMNAVL